MAYALRHGLGVAARQGPESVTRGARHVVGMSDQCSRAVG